MQTAQEFLRERDMQKFIKKANRWTAIVLGSFLTGFVSGHLIAYIFIFA